MIINDDKSIVMLLLLFMYVIQSNAQVLMNINGEDIYSEDFIRVYQKNQDIIIEDEEKSFQDYFDLFVEFKLKLIQAHDLQLDTLPHYLAELEKYREQLIQPYLQNPEMTEVLIREAYQRTIEEVEASHILIKLPSDASGQDTIQAYQRISEAARKIAKGDPFESVAKSYSEDPSVSVNGGNLGYFSAFSMVYPFENAAYNTEVGSLSEPFRTQFGYHVVKVNDRRKSPGEVEVGHIMVRIDSLNPEASKNKIDDIFNKLSQGDDFETIAKEHSDDKSSSRRGGKLPKFGTGRMIKSFEEVAFSLTNENDFSKPFKSQYGWHILKLLKKYPVGSYADLYEKLESKVKNSSRAIVVEKSLAKKISEDYKIYEHKELLYSVSKFEDFKENKEPLLKIQDQSYLYEDFYKFGAGEKNLDRSSLYNDFRNKMIIEYYKDHLEETDEDFAIVYEEYKDGLLLFELLQKEIWEKSEKDSLGLQAYFDSRRENYVWKRRGRLSLASCTRIEKAQEVKKLMLNGLGIEQIKESVNEGATIHVLFSDGKLEEGSSKLPKDYQLKMGVSDIYEEEKNNFTIIKVDAIFEPQWKELNETRGEVMNDYQNYLEDLWVKSLYKNYKVKVNKKVYKELEMSLTEK